MSMTTDERVNVLERRSRLWRGIASVGFALLAWVFLSGQAHPEERLDMRVRSLQVLDESGKVRIELRAAQNGPAAVLLSDCEGRLKAQLFVTSKGTPALMYRSEDDPAVASLTINEWGAVLSLRNPKTRAGLRAGIGPGGWPSIDMLDAEGELLWTAPYSLPADEEKGSR